MANVHCFTSATFSYLDRVRVLFGTLRQHHPDWTLWLCLVDREPPGFTFALAQEPFDRVVRIEELGIGALPRWMFVHDVVELCTAAKGPMLCKLLDSGARKVVYLDPDIAVFGSLAEIETLLEHHDVVLTPHQLEPEATTAGVAKNEINSLKFGVYNLGFLAVAGTDEGRRFAEWWRERLLDFCFDDVANGLFTDQRWCDLAPAFFPGAHIWRDPGCNVASWNLSRRTISIDQAGTLLAAGKPLRFFHFTKIMHAGAAALELYGHDRIEVFELMLWYRERLAAHAPEGLPDNWWAYGTYNNGVAISREHRRIYRDRADLKARFPDPFEAGPDMFSAGEN